MKYIILFSTLFITILSFAQEKMPFEQNKTYTYNEAHSEYLNLGEKYPTKCKFIQFGTSDHGENIALFLINSKGKFQQKDLQDQTILLINNAIHPGEPCGVDASIKLSKELLANEDKLPDNVVIGIIPIYNVGGALNRNCCSRANQNGPEMYGFRGNAKNLDLNRDFIKCDSRNTRVFYKIFKFLNPHVFVDTHTSNGADYQHTMTLITSQLDKMHPYLHNYTEDSLQPYLFNQMDQSGYTMVPYVHQMKKTPDDGIYDYLETPRYSTGYTNLFNTISFVTETHMLKPFEDRVLSTYTFLKHLINYMDNNNSELKALKQKADYNTGHSQTFPINWKLDTTKYDLITFKGFEAKYKPSEVTGAKRLYYDRQEPWTKEIKYYKYYKVTDSVRKPSYYVIPQAWQDVIIRLQLNGIKLYRLKNDKNLSCEVYYIDTFSTVKYPYEGHYLHRNIEVSKINKEIQLSAGDYVAPTRNANAQFLVNTLEPHAPDSYFAWNYFDGILQQKEWFSAYVYEDKAKEILENNPDLQKKFNEKRKNDETFAQDSFQQLYYIYKHSDNYERTHNQYPIYRYMEELMNDEIELAPRLIGG